MQINVGKYQSQSVWTVKSDNRIAHIESQHVMNFLTFHFLVQRFQLRCPENGCLRLCGDPTIHRGARQPQKG